MIGAIATAAFIVLVNNESGTPYIRGGHSPHGTDCSGLVSQLANDAAGRDPFATRFDTRNEEAELHARGFLDGTGAPGDLIVGWNSYHTAATLPDGTPVSSGEGGGVHVGGGGAFEPQFNHHAFMPAAALPPDAV